jgi:glycosyltransferase involved in cell wall biosynthesis
MDTSLGHDERSESAGDATTREVKHISVCICTYKRELFLKRLLTDLRDQDTDGLFTYSIVVADNDALQSAKGVVSNFAATSKIPITYCVEPRQNIPSARNKAIENSSGDFIALIDDDEFPTKRWLLTLLSACNSYGVDGALGPVMRHFDGNPPKWIVKGGFYQRATYPTGLIINWTMGRTNNALLNKRIFSPGVQPFRPEFRVAEDQDFFRRMIESGFSFVWCNEAIVYEVVPPVRWKRTFILRRALLRGAMATLLPTFGAREVVKSLIAVSVYAVALPFAFVCGHHRFMALAEKLCDHAGMLLALLGFDPVKEAYVTE